MKTVWVNRVQTEDTLKPMCEWQQISVKDDTTHARVQWGEIWQVSEKGCSNIWDDNKTVCFEHIGNQRGDGRFYIDDGHLPQDTRNHLVVAWFRPTGVPIIMESRHLLISHEDIESWMPLCKKPKALP